MNLFQQSFPFSDTQLKQLGIILNQAIEFTGRERFLHNVHLVTPSETDFPTSGSESLAERIVAIFRQTRKFSGLAAVACELAGTADSEQAIKLSELPESPILVSADENPGPGIPCHCQGPVRIEFDPHQVNNPQTLVTTFCLELIRQCSSSEPDHKKLLILAITQGFGIFIINHTIIRNQLQSNRLQETVESSLYSDEFVYELVYVMAIFTLLKSIAHHEVEAYLKTPVHKIYRQALNSLENQPQCLEQISGLKTRLRA